VPLHEIGARGVELLLAQIAGESRDVCRVVLPVQFKKGESTASFQSEPGA
jgi:DNA-binding LacI/PurR family transcriptional regulator